MLVAKHNADQVAEYLQQVAGKLDDPLRLLLPWGNAVGREARANARKKGGRRFWREVARATRVQTVNPSAVSVANWHVAGAQKQYGGVITPKRAKALTIPISPEAEGRRAGEFEMGGRELFVVKKAGRDSRTAGILGYSEGDSFHALFVLRTAVDPPADPWWPTDARVNALGQVEAERFLSKGLQG